MSLVKKFMTVGFSTLGSRVFGLVRDMLMASALGTGAAGDIFAAAFRFPNLFRRLFAEGVLNTAFVPLFSRRIEEDGDEGAKRFASEIFALLFALLIGFTILIELAMPLLVRHIVVPGFAEDPDKLSVTIRLTAIMFPYLAFMSLAALMAGMLNSLRRYFAAAIAPIFLNIILISVLAYAHFAAFDPIQTVGALAWGVLAAGVVQLAIVFGGVRRAGMTFPLRLPKLTPGVRRFFLLAIPAIVTGGVTQINQLIGQAIASGKSGAIVSLYLSDRVYQLPLGMIGIAVGVVLLPELSRALKAKHYIEARGIQNRSIEFVLFLTLPAAAGIWALSEEIVRVLYERGGFTAESTAVVSSILTVYGFGLPAYVLIKALQPGFFAREDTKTPMRFTMAAMALNVVLALTLFPLFEERGIATAEITAGWLNTLLLGTTLLRKGHLQPERIMVIRIIKLVGCAIAMGIVARLAANVADEWLLFETNLMRAATLGAIIVFAMVVYFPLTLLTGAADKAMIGRNMRRKTANPNGSDGG